MQESYKVLSIELKKGEAVCKGWKRFIQKLPVQMGLKIMNGDSVISEEKKVYCR